MTIDEINIIWLDLFNFVGYNKKAKLLEIFKGKDIRHELNSSAVAREILNQSEINKMMLATSDEFLKHKLEKYRADGIEIITIYDNRYPYMLRQTSEPPFCLYCKGNVQLLNTYCIGVVGSRRVTEYGTIVTKQYTKAFVENDITVVSGLAGGVDTIAHKTAIENNGKTIAVLAGGLYHLYPAFNANLAKQMYVDNLVISEMNPEIIPASFYFPIRNRIIAGLSHGVLLTEAGEKSGALHTKQYAIDYNREIFVVPGRINSEMSKGCNKIIKELQGAITLSPDDVLETLGIEKKEKIENQTSFQLDINQQKLLQFIQSEKRTFQEISDYMNLPANELNSLIMELEVAGLIASVGGNSYIMC